MTCSGKQSPASCNDNLFVSDNMSGSGDTDLVNCSMWNVCVCVRGRELETMCLCV